MPGTSRDRIRNRAVADASGSTTQENIERCRELIEQLKDRTLLPNREYELAVEALALAESAQWTEGIAHSYHALGVALCEMGEVEQSRSCMERAAMLFKEIGNVEMSCRVQYSLLVIRLKSGNPEGVLAAAEQNLTESKRLGDLRCIAQTLNLIAEIHRNQGDYVTAMVKFLDGLKFAEQIGAEDIMGVCYSSIGLCARRMHDLDMAVEYMLKSLDVGRKEGDSLGVGITLCNLATVYVMLEDYSKAGEAFKKSREIFRRSGSRDREAHAISGFADICIHTGDLQEGLRHVRHAMRKMPREAPTELQFSINNVTGRLYHTAGDYESAIHYLERARDILESAGTPYLRFDIYASLSYAYEQCGQIELAYRHFKLFTQYREASVGPEAQTQFHTALRHLEERELQEERLRLQRRTEELERRLLAKEKELTSVALESAQKQQLLARIKHQMTDFNPAKVGAVRETVRQLEVNLRTGSDWDVVVRQLHDVHPGFFERLAARSSAISPAEMKICGLMRINLSSKEISNILFIAPRTVEIHRGRIRKKLGVPSRDSLTSFLMNI